MPRNSSGTYTLPESAFVSGTIIESAKVNSNNSDIATALTQSLATTGVSTMTGQFKSAAGSVASPGITFSGSLTTGFYRSAADEISWSAAGVQQGIFAADGNVTFSGNLAVGGTLSITGAAAFTDGITGNSLVVTTSATIGSNLNVGGNVPVVGNVSVGASLFVGSELRLASGFIEGTEISTPATASANKAKLFVRDVSGTAEFAYINDSGVVIAVRNAAIIQRLYSEYTTNASLTDTIPLDDTIPQSNEGTQILSATITLSKSTNRVRARFQGWGWAESVGTGNIIPWVATLLLNSDTDALAAAMVGTNDSEVENSYAQVVLEFEHAPGSVGPHEYKINAGPINGAGTPTLRLNGDLSNRLFGGVSRATLIVEEIAV